MLQTAQVAGAQQGQVRCMRLQVSAPCEGPYPQCIDGHGPTGARRETWREQLCRAWQEAKLGASWLGLRRDQAWPAWPSLPLAGADPLQNCTLSNLPVQIWSLASFDADWYSDVLESRSRAS